MRKVIQIIFLTFFISAIKCGALEISGNSHITERELLSGTGANISDDSLISNITAVYRKAGFFNIKIEPIHLTNKGEKAIKIDEGHRSAVDSVSIDLITTNHSLTMSQFISELRGKPASQENLDNFANECIDYLAENGMPYASGSWSNFELTDKNDLDATFRIVSGPITYIAGLKYRGVKRSRPATLNRQLQIRPGSLFCRSKIIESETILEKMPYIDISASFAIEPAQSPDSCYIVFNIDEKPSTKFDGIAGISSGAGKSNFIGQLNLELGDILGTGRAFGFNWNRKDSRSSELHVNYLEPYILNSTLDLSLSAFQEDHDTLYISNGGSIGLSHKFGSGLTGGVVFTFGRTVPEDSSFIIGSTNREVSARFEYDHTDLPENPRTGYDFLSTINYKYRSNQFDSLMAAPLPTKLTSIGFDIHNYLPVTARLIAAIRLNYWGIVANDAEPPPDELKYIGGFDNLRGYVEKRFPAERYGLVSIEPRIITGKYSRAYLFGDLAIINPGPGAKSHHETGYGFGMAAPSTLGQFKLEIAWGKTGFPADAIFNFGLAGKF